MTDKLCVKLETKEHIAAHLEKRELVRDAVPIECDERLLEKLSSNYIIVKKILSNLQWQDQLLCKLVCRMWCDAVRAVQRELLAPQDFVIDIQDGVEPVYFKKSAVLPTEPLTIFTFTNFAGFDKMKLCENLHPCPCAPACENQHCILDWIDQDICYPKECMLIVKAGDLCYMPLPTSVTASHTFTNDALQSSSPYLCGTFIPKITDVEYNVINIKANGDMQRDFVDVVNKMSETRIFKGILVFVTDKYLLTSSDDLVYLNHFNKVQPNAPYALGGCIVEDVCDRADLTAFVTDINNAKHRAAFVSEHVLSIATFSVQKDGDTVINRNNFEMFSLVIESCDWSKANIQKSIKEFSERVPRFEHSLVFKLTCVGRDEKHEFEQNTFRAAFPETPLIGCYGNGELGLNHPPPPEPKAPINAKRQKRSTAQYGIMYSYSSVFVYCGWGRVTSGSGKLNPLMLIVATYNFFMIKARLNFEWLEILGLRGKISISDIFNVCLTLGEINFLCEWR